MKKRIEKSKKSVLGKLLPFVLAAALCLPLAACNTDAAGGSAKDLSGYASIGINPSVSFTTDSKGKVVSVRAENADARILLSDMQLKGLSLEEAVKKVTASAEETGYLNAENKTVNIVAVGETDAATQALTRQAKDGAVTGSALAKVTGEGKAWGREVQKLKEQNPDLYADLNAAKLKLIQAIAVFDPTFTVEIGTAMSVKDLKDLLEEHADAYEDLVTDEIEDKFDKLYAARIAEIQAQIDALYGEEYAQKAATYRAGEALENELEKEMENAELTEADVLAIGEIFGLTDLSEIQDDLGKVTVKSAEAYLDKLEDKWDELADDGDEAMEEVLDAAEELLETYEADDAPFTDAQIQRIGAVFGADATIRTLDELDEYLETLEDELDELRDEIVLTSEKKAEKKQLEAQKRDVKAQIKEELKEESAAAREALKQQKKALKENKDR